MSLLELLNATSFTCMSHFTNKCQIGGLGYYRTLPTLLDEKYINSEKDRALCNSKWPWRGCKIRNKHWLAKALSARVLLTPICHSDTWMNKSPPQSLSTGKHGEGDRINFCDISKIGATTVCNKSIPHQFHWWKLNDKQISESRVFKCCTKCSHRLTQL